MIPETLLQREERWAAAEAERVARSIKEQKAAWTAALFSSMEPTYSLHLREAGYVFLGKFTPVGGREHDLYFTPAFRAGGSPGVAALAGVAYACTGNLPGRSWAPNDPMTEARDRAIARGLWSPS